MPKKSSPAVVATSQSERDPASLVSSAILSLVGHVPHTSQSKSRTPVESAREVAAGAALKAATVAGTLSLPPGPLGLMTVLPEMLAVWRIQSHMVADISALYGKKGALTREQMLYCLFKHTASQALRDLVVRVGERFVVQRVSLRALQPVAQRIGVKLTQRTVAKSAARWMPVIGAIGVGAYAYYDTAQVAIAAMDLFERDIELQGDPGQA